MNVHELTTAPPPELSEALQRFEKQFHYPLGPEQSFHISHGQDYARFFRAMGEGRCFVAEREGRVLGVLGAALRSLALPGGEERLTVYFGDLKIDPSARGGRTLMHLASSLRAWLNGRTEAGFAVVMDGTTDIPVRYTGRLGLPAFVALGKVVVIRLTAGSDCTGSQSCSLRKGWRTTEADGEKYYAHLGIDAFSCRGGHPAVRSEMPPWWLASPCGSACGCLEDTLRAKRLYADDGREMRYAHLSHFAYRNIDDGVELLRVALAASVGRGLADLFVAVPATDAPQFAAALSDVTVILAPATVFGTGLASEFRWNINVTEI